MPDGQPHDERGYRYHAFISYRRGRIDEHGRKRTDDVERWVERYFEPALERKLAEELGEAPALYFDQSELRTGKRWHRELAEALRDSLCLVPIWSKRYFRSRWCVSEWASFRSRAMTRGGDLILPVGWQTNLTMPPAADGLQIDFDFSEYRHSSEAFPKSELYIPFERLVKHFAQDLSDAIEAAPDWDDWEVVLAERHPDDPLDDLRHVLLERHPDHDRMLVEKRSRILRPKLVA